MVLLLLAYLAGVLTIVSPCILPVLPFVFARTDRPFREAGLFVLIGMAATFAAIATLAAVAGGWAVAANHYGRIAALVLMALFGVTLLIPDLAERLTRPVVALGNRLSAAASAPGRQPQAQIGSSLALGVATGFLWAPCAGPVLGLILTGAALQGASAQTTLLLLSYALGAATSLGLALVVGGRVFTAMKKSLGAGEWIKRALGALVIIAVVCVALGVDTGFLTRVSSASTISLEQRLLDRFLNRKGTASSETLAVEGRMPSLDGAVEWLNSMPLTAQDLKGKVILVDFWTYSCVNCLRALPYVAAWAEKYRDQGLVVIGVHAPEFAFEKQLENVRKAVADLKVTYPVAIDNNFAIWRAFNNQYWPAHYFIDAQGNVRHHHFGEGAYDDSERVIQRLLAEANNKEVTTDLVAVSAAGTQAAADFQEVRSPETYVGYARAEKFISDGGIVRDAPHTYAIGAPKLNEWGFTGDWTVHGENAVLNAPGGKVVYRFHARDLHLVLGPTTDGKPVRFVVRIDGAAPGANHGSDVDDAGQGTVAVHRLYQLVRQNGSIDDHTFEIEFLDPGVQAYAFTFG